MHHLATNTKTATRKLYSRNGTLLGTISYPEEYDLWLCERGSFTFVKDESFKVSDYFAIDPSMPDYKTITIYFYNRERGAVCLYGINPEEFEKIRDCSFAPSASYLRSVIE
jgi:hypothetical protein